MISRRKVILALPTIVFSKRALAIGGLISGLPSTLPTVRIIASRITPMNQVTSSSVATQAMCRTSHQSMTTITDIGLVLSNYYSRNWNGGSAPVADTGPGAAATVTASIEYPAGTFTQITFGGLVTGTIPDNDILISDRVVLSIPNNTQFWTRYYYQNSAGIVNQASGFSIGLGDATRVGTSGIVDQTMSGTITSNTGLQVLPVGIIGTSSRPSIAIPGTSIAAGVGGTLDTADILHGYQIPLTTTPAVNLAQGGAFTLQWITDHTIHQKMFQFCTGMMTDLGENDYPIQSVAQCVADLQTLYSLMPGKQHFQCTMLARVTNMGDGTVGPGPPGQTGQGGALGIPAWTAQKNMNTAIRAGFSGMTGYFDVDAQLESGFETGWWRFATDGFGNAAPWSNDGLHPTQSGPNSIRDNGIIDQTRFIG